MLRPSYSELMDILNNDSELDDKITSRYAIVIAASKRARQLIDGAENLAGAPTDKAVSIAVNEIHTGHIRIISSAQEMAREAQELHSSDVSIDYGESDEHINEAEAFDDESELEDDYLDDGLDFEDEDGFDEDFDDEADYDDSDDGEE